MSEVLPGPQGPAAAVLAVAQEAFDAFNVGDIARFRGTWADKVEAVINEASPHVWTGDRAIERWLDDSAAAGPAVGAPPRIELRRCLKSSVREDRAFLVLLVGVTTETAGREVTEEGVQISAWTLRDGRWRTTALAYGGGLDANAGEGIKTR